MKGQREPGCCSRGFGCTLFIPSEFPRPKKGYRVLNAGENIYNSLRETEGRLSWYPGGIIGISWCSVGQEVFCWWGGRGAVWWATVWQFGGTDRQIKAHVASRNLSMQMYKQGRETADGQSRSDRTMNPWVCGGVSEYLGQARSTDKK